VEPKADRHRARYPRRDPVRVQSAGKAKHVAEGAAPQRGPRERDANGKRLACSGELQFAGLHAIIEFPPSLPSETLVCSEGSNPGSATPLPARPTHPV
jgi:hypothetical protein